MRYAPSRSCTQRCVHPAPRPRTDPPAEGGMARRCSPPQGAAAPAAPTACRSSSRRGRNAAARDDHHPGHEQGMTSPGTWTIRAPGLPAGLASPDSLSPARSPEVPPCARHPVADAVDAGASVVVAVSAEGLDGGHARAGPLRHGAAGRAPGGVPVRVRAPGPARAASLGPALAAASRGAANSVPQVNRSSGPKVAAA
jgi:hypothetical protein